MAAALGAPNIPTRTGPTKVGPPAEPAALEPDAPEGPPEVNHIGAARRESRLERPGPGREVQSLVVESGLPKIGKIGRADGPAKAADKKRFGIGRGVRSPADESVIRTNTGGGDRTEL